MVCKIFLVVIVSALLVIQRSMSNPLENEKLVKLSDQLNILQNRMESLEAENEALKIRVDRLERKYAENEPKIIGEGEEINEFKARTGAKLDSWTRAVGHVPSSCRELSQIGHVLDGLYLVQNSNTKKIETVLCTFGTAISEAMIGQVDVKTKTVHFYVQRESSFNESDAVIPFDVAPVNEGNAFDLASGIFTVPVPGIYHFDFSTLRYQSPHQSSYRMIIYLQVNAANVGCATYGWGGNTTVSLSVSLRLAAGDRVNLFNRDSDAHTIENKIVFSYFNDDPLLPYPSGSVWTNTPFTTGGWLYDDSDDHYTHFSGWLVEEKLM